MRSAQRLGLVGCVLLSSWLLFRCGSQTSESPAPDGSVVAEDAGPRDASAPVLRGCGEWIGEFTEGSSLSGWTDVTFENGKALLVSRSIAPEKFGLSEVRPNDEDGLLVEFGLSPLAPLNAATSNRSGEDSFTLVASHPSGARILAGTQKAAMDAGGRTSVTLERRSPSGAVVWQKAWTNVGGGDRLTVLPGGDVLLAGSQSNPGARSFDGITTTDESIWAVRVSADTGAVRWATAFGSSGTGNVFVADVNAAGEIVIGAQTRASGSFVGDLEIARLAPESGAIQGKYFVNGASSSAVRPGLSAFGGFLYGGDRLVVAGSLRGTLGNVEALIDSGAKEQQALVASYSTSDAGLLWYALAEVGRTSSPSSTGYSHVVRIARERLVACSETLECEERSEATGVLLRAFSFPRLPQVLQLRYAGGKFYVSTLSLEYENDEAGVRKPGRRRGLYCFEE